MSGSSNGYTWVDYQLWMMGLSLTLFVALLATEFILRKVDVLHIIYNEMLKLKNRKLIMHNVVDITDNYVITSNLNMAVRLTVILVVSYLWQFCVIESNTVRNGGYPSEYCLRNYSCFQAPLRWDTFMFASDFTPIDCSIGGAAGFTSVSDNIVVSCFQVLEQTAPNWIQNLAISNAFALLISRLFEIQVWASFHSMAYIVAISLFGILLLIFVLLAGLLGMFSNLASSWLGFIVMLIVPFLIYMVRSIAIEIRRLRRDEIHRLHERTRNEFKSIARQFSPPPSRIVGTLRRRNDRSASIEQLNQQQSR